MASDTPECGRTSGWVLADSPGLVLGLVFSLVVIDAAQTTLVVLFILQII